MSGAMTRPMSGAVWRAKEQNKLMNTPSAALDQLVSSCKQAISPVGLSVACLRPSLEMEAAFLVKRTILTTPSCRRCGQQQMYRLSERLELLSAFRRLSHVVTDFKSTGVHGRCQLSTDSQPANCQPGHPAGNPLNNFTGKSGACVYSVPGVKVRHAAHA